MTLRKTLAASLPAPLRDQIVAMSGKRMHYLKALTREPVDEHAVLFESRHGEAFEGNMFYLARTLLRSPAYRDFTVYLPAKPDRAASVRRQAACLPHLERTRIVEYNSPAYFHALATCKYLFNDTSFLHCFYKRPEQIYANTWHGTPLKHLGRFVPNEAVKMGNVQRNLLCADYLLNPNRFTADALFDCYMMRGLFQGESLLMGYPRNSALQDRGIRQAMRARYGLDGKRVYAFMPTYRGLNGSIDARHLALTRRHLELFDARCRPDELVLFNPHPFMGSSISTKGLSHVRAFPADAPSYDVLAACDGLITDYSSVCFDYLCTGRPVVLFTHDVDNYCTRDRGLYFEIENMGFPHARDIDGVLALLRDYPAHACDALRDTYCPFDSPDAAQAMVDFVIRGIGHPAAYQPSETDSRRKVLVDVSSVEAGQVQAELQSAFDDPGLDRYHYYLTFRRDKPGVGGLLRQLGTKVDYFSIGGTALMAPAERCSIERIAGSGRQQRGTSTIARRALSREWQRRFGGASFDDIVSLGCCDRLSKALYEYALGQTASTPPAGNIERETTGTDRDRQPAQAPKARLLLLNVSAKAVFMAFSLPTGTDEASARLSLQNRLLERHIDVPVRMHRTGALAWGTMRFDPASMPLREVYWDLALHVRSNETRYDLPVTVDYAQLALMCVQDIQCRLGDHVLFPFVRRGMRLAFTYRAYYPRFDTPLTRMKELAAIGTYVLLKPYWDNRRIWLVFEKFCNRAQDNGSSFFRYCMEELPESERQRVFFVLDDESPDCTLVSRWQDHVVPFMSIKHMVYALAAQIYVGSDSAAHLYEWRSKPSAVRFLIGRKPIFFLQHGVMALKRTDGIFGADGPNRMTYFLTSSQREQRIIVDHFGYPQERVPVLGLPRWDDLSRRSRKEGSQILLMPTWRSWLEEADDDTFRESAYFKTYARLISSDSLARALERHNARLVVYLHPKFAEHTGLFESSDRRITTVNESDVRLSDLLARCRMLITDYSSVCWDMLYQEKPVLFYQFDRDLYQRSDGSYLNLETELPGPSYTDEDALIEGIDGYAANGYRIEPEYAQRAHSWFAYRDSHNCQRSYIFLSNALGGHRQED